MCPRNGLCEFRARVRACVDVRWCIFWGPVFGPGIVLGSSFGVYFCRCHCRWPRWPNEANDVGSGVRLTPALCTMSRPYGSIAFARLYRLHLIIGRFPTSGVHTRTGTCSPRARELGTGCAHAHGNWVPDRPPSLLSADAGRTVQALNVM